MRPFRFRKEKVGLARIMEESSVMLQDTSLMDYEKKKWLINKKEINERD